MLSHPKKFPKKHEQIVHYRNKTHSKKELGTKIMKEVDNKNSRKYLEYN